MMTETYSDVGHVYPPRDERDVLAYDHTELWAGFNDFDPDKPEPDATHPPAYRWAWRSRARRCKVSDDGFDDLRRAASHLWRALA